VEVAVVPGGLVAVAVEVAVAVAGAVAVVVEVLVGVGVSSVQVSKPAWFSAMCCCISTGVSARP
jgi:hypothetical protein